MAPARVERVLLVCFFLSGASGLVYEVVWLRWLILLFGATTLAVSTVLATFMGGLGMGSWIAGRLIARIRAPLGVYGLLELAIGGYALVLPVLLAFAAPALPALRVMETSSPTIQALTRVPLAAALLLLPTACMGATLPLLAQVTARRLRTAGGHVGRLYAVNTAGAVVGAAAAGFLLLPLVGLILTTRVAVALSATAGLAALWIGRLVSGAGGLAPPHTAADARPSAPKRPAPGLADTPAIDPAPVVAFGTIALSGALAMVYEVAWSRALTLVVGSSVYAFTVMLTTSLVGLAAGSYAAARCVDRLRTPGLTLAWAQVLAGATAFGSLVALDELPYLFLRLFALSGGRHVALVTIEFVVAGTVILGPAFLSGAVFPLALRLAARAEGRLGQTTASVYALNTVGAIVGAFLAGFVLLPTVGIRGTLLLAIVLNVSVGSLVLAALPGPRRAPQLAAAAALPLVALAAVATAPAWNRLTMTSGVAVYGPSLGRLARREFQQYRRGARLLFYEEGLTTTVSVEDRAGVVSLRVNGKPDASTAGVDMATQVLLGHLPVLFHPDPHDILVIGLGSGVSAGSVLRHPVRALTVVELEPAVIRASRFFNQVNFRPLEDPRTRMVTSDARNFLWLTPDRFDVIISEPSNPWMTVAASLFTREFFQLAKDRMRPDGIFAQWLHLYSLTPEMLQTLMATFATVFPQTTVFRASGLDAVLVGHTASIQLDYAALARRMAAPPVAADLDRIGIRSVADLFGRLTLDVDDVPRFVSQAPLNTDDNARIEFAAPRALYVNAIPEIAQRMAAAAPGVGTALARIARGAPDGFTLEVARRRQMAQPR